MQCFPKCEGHFVAINGNWALVDPPARRLTLVSTEEILSADLVADVR
jgi:hypothetical protein